MWRAYVRAKTIAENGKVHGTMAVIVETEHWASASFARPGHEDDELFEEEYQW